MLCAVCCRYCKLSVRRHNWVAGCSSYQFCFSPHSGYITELMCCVRCNPSTRFVVESFIRLTSLLISGLSKHRIVTRGRLKFAQFFAAFNNPVSIQFSINFFCQISTVKEPGGVRGYRWMGSNCGFGSVINLHVDLRPHEKESIVCADLWFKKGFKVTVTLSYHWVG